MLLIKYCLLLPFSKEGRFCDPRSEGVQMVSAENPEQDKKQLFKAISSFYAAVTSCTKLEKYQSYISHKT